MYEAKKQMKDEKEQKIRDNKQARKDRRDQRSQNQTDKLKSRRFGVDPALVQPSEDVMQD